MEAECRFGGSQGLLVSPIPLQVVSPLSLGVMLHSSLVPVAAPVTPSFPASPPCFNEVDGWRVDVEGQARVQITSKGHLAAVQEG